MSKIACLVKISLKIVDFTKPVEADACYVFRWGDTLLVSGTDKDIKALKHNNRP